MSSCYQAKYEQYLEAGKNLFQSGDEIVVSGMAGRFPMSRDVEELQENFFKKVNMVTQHPRWYPQLGAQNYCGTIDSLEKFDAGFFGVHYTQAQYMDPQVRMLLEHTFEALVDAGCNPQKLRGSRVGVFVANNILESNQKLLFNSDSSFGLTGCLLYSLAHWISYSFELKGPSVMVDSACSSGLMAVDEGYKAIKQGLCDSAIVGGSHLCMHPVITERLTGVINPIDYCRSFDMESNGYVRSEAVSVLYLQKQNDAKRIYAKIVHVKSLTGFGQDPSFGCPSIDAQVELIRAVSEECDADPNDLDFVEAHGTGTVAGDPLEVSALDNALCKHRCKALYLAASKSNLGHTEPVSGIVSIIKVVGCFEEEAISPNLHFFKPRSGMDALEKGRMVIPTDVVPLQKDTQLIAAINNLGYGGANTYGVFKTAAKQKKNRGVPLDDLPRLVCVSGRTEKAVEYLFDRLANQSVDEELVGLLHEVFSDNIEGHLYRGYIILSKKGEFKRSVTKTPSQKYRVCVQVHEAKQLPSFKYLAEIPTFKAIVDDIISLSTPKNQGAVLGVLHQVVMLEFLKLLGVDAEYQAMSEAGALVCSYAKGMITLKKVIEKICADGFSNVKSGACVIVNVGTFYTDITKSSSLTSFLSVLGRIYQLGHVLKLHKLYPKVSWPVSKRTPMISPLIQWKHDEDWYVVNYKTVLNGANDLRVVPLKTSLNEWNYIKGNLINSYNLIPSSTYICMVWETLALHLNQEMVKTPIKLENIRFLQDTIVTPNTQFNFTVSLHKRTQKFEVEESGKTILSGSYSTENVVMSRNDINVSCHSEPLISFKDVYKEFKLRGYTYSDLFRSLQQACTDGSKGYLKWNDNWPVFIDGMQQILLLRLYNKSLYTLKSIGLVLIDPEAHLKYIKEVGEHQVPLSFCKSSGVLRSGFIEMTNINSLPTPSKKDVKEPLLEMYQFVPFESKLRLKDAIRVCIQIVCENYHGKDKISLVELVHDSMTEFDLLMPEITEIFSETVYFKCQPRVFTTNAVEIKDETVKVVSASEITEIDTTSLIVTSHALTKPQVIQQIQSALKKNGMLLTKESLKLDVGKLASEFGLCVICIYQAGRIQLALLKKQEKQDRALLVDLSPNEDVVWLPVLKKALKQNTQANVVLHSTNQKLSGLLGFFNCLKLEEGARVMCFMMFDEAPEFDLENSFYSKQAEKRLAVNVFKDGQWGSYRHLKLAKQNPVPTKCVKGKFATIGNFSSFRWLNQDESEPVEGLIPLDVYYSTVNFKDVMSASGRVVDGEGSEHVICYEVSGKDRSGRRYMGYSMSSSLANVAHCSPDKLLEVPESWSLEDAATVSNAYVTAIFSLIKIAKLQQGQSVLIHCGAGGVGQAAINIALQYNCKIFTTVGTPKKRAFILKEFPQIRASQIGNSRDASFEQMVMKRTNGKGVNVVLNCLSGDKLLPSLRCLAPKGKFVEIGKSDTIQNRLLNSSFVNGNRSYCGVMLDTFDSLPAILNTLKMIHPLIQRNVVKPLKRTVFNRDEVPEAFHYMSTGEHIGKVVLEIKKEEDEIFAGFPSYRCRSRSSYIVLGGLGGFGLELGNWLIARGAKNLVLTSRTGVKSGYQKRYVEHWKKTGVRVVVSTSDVITKTGCLKIVQQANGLGQVDGIFNLAVVLKDALIENLTEKGITAALIPKSIATRYLDEITREICPELRHFVVFSSVSCGKGNAGQTNYGMANSIMERICEQRRRDGYPGLAIQWGVIGDVGLVADMLEEKKLSPMSDLKEQPIESCLEVLGSLLTQPYPVVLSMVVDKTSNKLKSQSTVDVIAYEVFGISNTKTISYHASLNELGLDSFATTVMKQLLEREYDIFLSNSEIRELTLAKLDAILSKTDN